MNHYWLTRTTFEITAMNGQQKFPLNAQSQIVRIRQIWIPFSEPLCNLYAVLLKDITKTCGLLEIGDFVLQVKTDVHAVSIQ